MAGSDSFVHLHLHTHYSLLDGATRIGDLVNKTKEYGMPAVAITDHGNMFGVIEFYTKAKAAGVKPIIGCELYIAPGDRRSKESAGMREASNHLLFLAQNLTGYKNLCKLTSIAYREGFYYKPRIDRETLEQYSEGLICTSACLGGEIPQALLKDDRPRAKEIAEYYLRLFGPDRFFIELQDHGLQEQKMTNPELAGIAKELGLGIIATNDVHYLDHADVEAHDVLCCINTGALQADESRFRFETDQFYFKSPQEMRSLFANYEEALDNTLRIADMCDLDLEFGKRYAPVYKVPEQKTDKEYLRELVYKGAEERYPEITDEVRERIDYELSVIQGKGFSSYFLIVWDFMNYARKCGIPCGTRGSGCSSVVGHCLYISAPEPLRYGLYFERFMDPDRDEMPDIDVDICQNGRQDVIDYVRKKYGHVAQIITYGTLKAKAAVKDVSRVLGLDFNEANKLTSMIPAELKMTIDKALNQNPDLKKLYDSDDRIRKVIEISKRLEGLARHVGIHAAGVVVADMPLDDLLPLYKTPSDEEQIVTQYDGPTVEKVGLLKMDFLGLRTLSTMERARQLVLKGKGIDIDMEQIDLTDQKVYDLFRRGDTKGVFQFESDGMRGVLLKMRPNRIEDLIAANALYRPGPMQYIDSYVARKHGEAWTTPHPIMSEVLNETYGILVYQEQVSRLVNRLGGVELKQAFRLAKAISKKKEKMIEAQREPFLQGCVDKGVARETAEKVFDDILKFGEYAFNKAHSTGYGIVAYKTAYLKAYHPVEFMAALITFEMSSTDKVMEYIEECRRMEIEVLPPDVNSSGTDFTVDYNHKTNAIRFGLAAIKGIGEKATDAIVAEREANGRFKDIFDFCERIDSTMINRGALEALINCGAFDSTGAMRKALVLAMDRALQAGAAAQRDKASGQMSLFGEMAQNEPASSTTLSDEEWNEADMLAREKGALGFYITKHPLTHYSRLVEACSTAQTRDLKGLPDKTSVLIGGMVSTVRTINRDRGKMGVISLEDLSGRVDALVFDKQFDQFRPQLNPDAIVFIDASVDKRREEPCLRVNNVYSVVEAPFELCDAVMLSIDSELADEAMLEAITTMLKKHASIHNSKQVYLDIRTPENLIATINCGSDLRISLSTGFLQEARELLGDYGVTLIASTRKPIPLDSVMELMKT